MAEPEKELTKSEGFEEAKRVLLKAIRKATVNHDGETARAFSETLNNVLNAEYLDKQLNVDA